MNLFRVAALLLLLAALLEAAKPRTVVRTVKHRASETRSCELMLIAVDGKSLGTPRQDVTLSPGHHALSVRAWFLAKGKVWTTDLSIAEAFKPHAYLIDGGFLPSGKFELMLEDEDERPRGVKHENTR
jgi:hypothetical protein